MRTKAYKHNLDEEILSASPLELIQLLYRRALDSIASARRYVNLKDIRGRCAATTKALAIVNELSLSLNHERGGELSRSLAELYSYIARLLIQSNSQQSEAPLTEAEGLLGTLSEAWDTNVRKESSRAAGAQLGKDSEPSLAY